MDLVKYIADHADEYDIYFAYPICFQLHNLYYFEAKKDISDED
mgnify:CR=1 FL=1